MGQSLEKPAEFITELFKQSIEPEEHREEMHLQHQTQEKQDKETP